MDERIVAKLAESEADPDDVNIDSHLQTLREAHKHETQAKEYLEQVTATQEYVTYLVATSRLDMDAAQAHPVVLQLLEAIQLLQQKAQQEVKCTNLPPPPPQLATALAQTQCLRLFFFSFFLSRITRRLLLHTSELPQSLFEKMGR